MCNLFELNTRDHETENTVVCLYNFLAIYNCVYLYSILHSRKVKKQLEIRLILVSQALFERKLVVHFFASLLKEMVLQ